MGVLWSLLGYQRSYTAVIFGLENAGKTSLLYRLTSKDEKVIPTIGFNIETLKVRRHMFQVFDVAGGFRSGWHTYYENADMFIYVIDATAFELFKRNRTYLHNMLKHPDVMNKPFLVCIHKYDSTELFDHAFYKCVFKTGSLRIISSSSSGRGIDEIKKWMYSTAECL